MVYSTANALHHQLRFQAERRAKQRRYEQMVLRARMEASRRREAERLAAEGIGSVVAVDSTSTGTRNIVNTLRGKAS